MIVIGVVGVAGIVEVVVEVAVVEEWMLVRDLVRVLVQVK